VIAKGASSVEALIAGGDDYEVLCAVPAARWPSLTAAALASGISITEIGTITSGQGAPTFLDASGSVVSLARTSYSHF